MIGRITRDIPKVAGLAWGARVEDYVKMEFSKVVQKVFYLNSLHLLPIIHIIPQRPKDLSFFSFPSFLFDSSLSCSLFFFLSSLSSWIFCRNGLLNFFLPHTACQVLRGFWSIKDFMGGGNLLIQEAYIKIMLILITAYQSFEGMNIPFGTLLPHCKKWLHSCETMQILQKEWGRDRNGSNQVKKCDNSGKSRKREDKEMRMIRET